MPTTNGCLTNATEQSVLDHLVNATTYSPPTTYLALWTGSPTDTGAGGTEVKTPGSSGYDRIATSGKWGTAASRSISTAAPTGGDFTFGPASDATWGQVDYWALMTAATSGSVIAYGQLTSATVGSGDSYKITGGNLTIAFTAGSKWTDTKLNAILEHIVGKTSLGSAANTWLALYDGDPLGAGGEVITVDTAGYARQDLDAAMSPASGGSITNGSAITFGPDVTTAWGNCDYFAVFEAASTGSPIGGAALTASKTIAVGDSAEFAISALTFTLD